MMSLTRAALSSLLVLLLHAASLAAAAAPNAATKGSLTLLTVFGDSNSDSGNAAIARRTFYNPLLNWPIDTYYYQGRFSNGPVWTEFVDNKCTSLQVNAYAVGFGTQCTANSVATVLLASNPATQPLIPLFPKVVSVQEQAVEYIKDLQASNATTSRGVYIWAAANDLSAVYFSDPAAPFGNVTKLSNAVIQATAACAADTVRTLYAVGERTFILGNLQPLDKTALITNLVAYGVYTNQTQALLLPSRIAKYVEKFNYYLRETVQDLRDELPAARIYYHNIHNAINRFLNGKLPALGFQDLRNACINFQAGSLSYQSLNTSKVAKLFNLPAAKQVDAVASVCPDPSKFADWDQNHFTTRAHEQVLAKEVIRFLKLKGLLCDTGC